MATETIQQIPLKHAGSFSLSVLGLGTYGIGGKDSRDFSNDDQGQIASLKEAIRLGLTHIDTAEAYADGYSELLIGKAIKEFDRQSIFLTTKVRRRNLGYDNLIRSARESLKRLGTPWIDLYLIHAPNRDIPLKETMRALDTLKEQKLIKNIGVSNFDVPLLQEALSRTKYGIVNNQIHYNLSARTYETNGALDFCQKNNILVTAYRAVGYNQYRPEGIAMLSELARKYDKTPTQIALNWIYQKPNIVTLVKSTDPKHLKENIAALFWEMDLSDIKYLDLKFPRSETINLP